MSNDEKAQACVDAFKPLADATTDTMRRLKTPEDGGAAFPVSVNATERSGEDFGVVQQSGMTLCDYFAAKAMQSIVQAFSLNDEISAAVKWDAEDQERAATLSYQLADAMIAARKKGAADVEL